MKKININLWKFLILSSALGSVVFLVAQKSLPILFHKSIYYCQSFLQGINIQVSPVAHFMLASFFGLFVLGIVARIIFILIRTISFRQSLNIAKIENKKLKTVVQKLRLEGKIVVFKHNKPYAFCLGISRPRIYLSTATLRVMNLAELEAVLLHERYHLHKKDVFVMFCASLSKLIFPFFPVLSDITSMYGIDREIKADMEAVGVVGRKILVSALTKFIDFPTQSIVGASSMADFDTLDRRIKFLMGGKLQRRPYSKINIVLSFVFTSLLVIFLSLPVQATEIHVGNTDTMMVCLEDKSCVEFCKKYGVSQTGRENAYQNSQKTNFPYTPVK